MKFIRQFLVILLVSLLGEVLHVIIPLPIPASIYGLVLMFVSLKMGIIPLEKVSEAGDFLIEIMPLMFIPAGVGLIASWAQLKEVFVPVAVITCVTTVVVMVAAGRMTQFILKKEDKKDE